MSTDNSIERPDDDEHIEDLEQEHDEITSVSKKKKKEGGPDYVTWAFLGVLAIAGVLIVAMGGEDEKKEEVIPQADNVDNSNSSRRAPQLRKPATYTPPPPPPKTETVTLSSPKPAGLSQEEKQRLAELEKRKKSPTVIFNNLKKSGQQESAQVSDARLAAERKKQDLLDGLNRNLADANGLSAFGQSQGASNESVGDKIVNSSDDRITATLMTNRAYTLSEGTMLPCTLETAINSDLPGKIRCILSENVYSDDGSFLLLRRGAKAVGEYQSGVRQGQARLFVIWNRLIDQTNGIDVALDSPGTGTLGQSGLTGWRDSHFFERFGGSMLLSMIGAVTAEAAAQGEANQETTEQIVDDFNKSAEIALENSINIPPTIYINQGISTKIFVNRDVDFKPVVQLLQASRGQH